MRVKKYVSIERTRASNLHSKHSQPTLASLGSTKPKRDATSVFSNEASLEGKKTLRSRSSSIRNSDSSSQSWSRRIDESVRNSPKSQFRNKNKWGNKDRDNYRNEH